MEGTKQKKLDALQKAREIAAANRELKKKAYNDALSALQDSLRIEEVAESPDKHFRYAVKTPSGKLLLFGKKKSPIFQDATELKLFGDKSHGDEKKRQSFIKKAQKIPVDSKAPKEEWETLPKAYSDPESALFYELKYFY